MGVPVCFFVRLSKARQNKTKYKKRKTKIQSRDKSEAGSKDNNTIKDTKQKWRQNRDTDKCRARYNMTRSGRWRQDKDKKTRSTRQIKRHPMASKARGLTTTKTQTETEIDEDKTETRQTPGSTRQTDKQIHNDLKGEMSGKDKGSDEDKIETRHQDRQKGIPR
jgi:hypothetical protein